MWFRELPFAKWLAPAHNPKMKTTVTADLVKSMASPEKKEVDNVDAELDFLHEVTIPAYVGLAHIDPSPRSFIKS